MALVRSWPFVFFIVLVVLAHFVLRLVIGIGSAAPDLLTVAALLAARRLNGAQAAALGLLLGVLDDALTLVSFGAGAVALTVVSFLGARSRDLFEGDSLLFIVVYLFIGKWLRDALVWALSPALRDADVVPALFVAMPITAVIAAGAGAAAMIVYRTTTGERT